MKLDFQAKFLQHLNKKKKGSEEGFTLIELLVVIIIIGILAAIALPSLIAQVSKGKQAEARQNVGALNRAQQAFFLEQSAFSTDISAVGIGINTQTVNFTYTILFAGDPSTTQTVANLGTSNNTIQANKPNTLRSYLGLNFTTLGGTAGADNTEVLALGKVCETKQPAGNVTSVAEGTTSCEAVDARYRDLGAK